MFWVPPARRSASVSGPSPSPCSSIQAANRTGSTYSTATPPSGSTSTSTRSPSPARSPAVQGSRGAAVLRGEPAPTEQQPLAGAEPLVEQPQQQPQRRAGLGRQLRALGGPGVP